MLIISIQQGSCLSHRIVSTKTGGTRSESSDTGLNYHKKGAFIHLFIGQSSKSFLCIRQCSVADKNVQPMSIWRLSSKRKRDNKETEGMHQFLILYYISMKENKGEQGDRM